MDELNKLWARVVALESHVQKLTAKAAEHGIHLAAEEVEHVGEIAGEEKFDHN